MRKLSDIFPKLDEACEVIMHVDPDLARNYEEFRDCIKQYDQKPDEESLDLINNQYMVILDKSESHFNMRCVQSVLYSVIEAQRAVTALSANNTPEFNESIAVIMDHKFLRK